MLGAAEGYRVCLVPWCHPPLRFHFLLSSQMPQSRFVLLSPELLVTVLSCASPFLQGQDVMSSLRPPPPLVSQVLQVPQEDWLM